MKWVPILNVVLTVVFYAMFPVIFPLFLMPTTGPIDVIWSGGKASKKKGEK